MIRERLSVKEKGEMVKPLEAMRVTEIHLFYFLDKITSSFFF